MELTKEPRVGTESAAHRSPSLRQSMAPLHTWAGLLAGWVLYAMFLTGAVSYFREEISQWMRPELPARQQPPPDASMVAERVARTLAAMASQSEQWVIELPGARGGTAHASWQVPEQGQKSQGEGWFDPDSGHQRMARATEGGDFFYYFHFSLHYLPRPMARWFVGLCTMFMMVALVSGVITHRKIFANFFTFRWGKGQRSWLDAHNAVSVLALPFHLMITYTGLVTLMTLYMPWGMHQAFPTPSAHQALLQELVVRVPPGSPSAVGASLTTLTPLVRTAQNRWGSDNVGRVVVNRPGDSAAQVIVVRGDTGRVSVHPEFLVFDGVNGALLHERAVEGVASQTRSTLYALHLGRFADTVARWLYFLLSLTGAAMVGTGLVLWVTKRRQRQTQSAPFHAGLWLVERLNIACIAGLPIAMASFLGANRLLPLHTPLRAQWEIHVFFIVWAMAFMHACMRPVRRAWMEQWAVGSLVLTLPVFLNAVTTRRGLFASLWQNDMAFIGLELTCLMCAVVYVGMAWRMAGR